MNVKVQDQREQMQNALRSIRIHLAEYIDRGRTGTDPTAPLPPIKPGHPIHTSACILECCYGREHIPAEYRLRCRRLIGLSRVGEDGEAIDSAARNLLKWIDVQLLELEKD